MLDEYYTLDAYIPAAATDLQGIPNAGLPTPFLLLSLAACGRCDCSRVDRTPFEPSGSWRLAPDIPPDVDVEGTVEFLESTMVIRYQHVGDPVAWTVEYYWP